jgi:DNA polymerase III delta prime subunit
MSRTGTRQQIFLLDEADQLTPAAQSALKAVIENAHGFFILTCNDLSKITEWIRSRCFMFEFKPIGEEDMRDRLTLIAGKEGVEIAPELLDLIIRAHAGDLRSAINALQVYDSMEEKDGRQFLHSLFDSDFDAQDFLTLCFREHDFDEALKLFEGKDTRRSIRDIFRYAMDSTALPSSKLTLIDAATTAERDLIMGVEPSITLANFVRMCVEC